MSLYFYDDTSSKDHLLGVSHQDVQQPLRLGLKALLLHLTGQLQLFYLQDHLAHLHRLE